MGLQRSLLRVTDKVEDQKALNTRIKVHFEREIEVLAKHIESLTPKKQSMINSVTISRALKSVGAKD